MDELLRLHRTTNSTDSPSEARSIGFRAVCPEPEPPERLRPSVTGLVDSQIWTMRWNKPVATNDSGEATGYAWELEGPEARNSGTEPISVDTLSVVFTDLPKGPYKFTIRSTGDCNKVSTDTATSFTVGLSQPCLNPPILFKDEGTIWSTWTVSWSAPDSGDPPVEYRWRMVGPTQPSGTVQPSTVTRGDDTYQRGGTVTVENLRPGKYTFFVLTVCNLSPTPPDTGMSGENEIAITVIEKAPQPPRDVTVETVESTITYEGGDANCPPEPSYVGKWQAPLSGTRPSNYEWELYRGSDAETGTRILPSRAGATPNVLPALTTRAVLGRLTPANYYFRVRSKAGVQTSEYRGHGFVVRPEPCPAPILGQRNPSVFRGVESQVYVWDPGPCGIAADSYAWRLRAVGAGTDFATGTAGKDARRAQLTNGTNGTRYTFYVRQVTGARGDCLEASDTFTWGASLLIPPPDNVEARSQTASGDSVYFRWDIPEDLPSDVTLTRYNWRMSGPSGYTATSGDVAAGATRRVNFNALAAGVYRFEIRTDTRTSTATAADSSLGGNVSVWVLVRHVVVGASSLQPPVIGPVTFITAFGAESWTVKWSPNTQGARPTGYSWRWRVKDAATNISGPTTTGISESARTAQLRNGTNGTVYEVLVKATRAGVPDSDEAIREINWGETLLVPPPEQLRAVRLTTDGASVYFRWDAPSGDLPADKTLRQYNWEISGVGTGSGDVASGSTLRVSLVGLAAGTHTFRVRTDTRASSSETADSGYGGNVSEWVTVNHTVTGLSCAPPNLRVVETETPRESGGSIIARAIEWDASRDPAVTGYRWSGDWTQTPNSGTTSAAARRVTIDHVPVGTHTIIVHGLKGNASCGSSSLGFPINVQTLEPPEGASVVGTNEPSGGSDSWTWNASWRPPTRGRPPTGYRIDLHDADDENPRQSETASSIGRTQEFTGLPDGDYEVFFYSTVGRDSSDPVSVSFTQPPEQALNPPEGLKVTPGTGASWNTANASWTRPSEGDAPDGYSFTLSGPTQETGDVTSTSHSFSNLQRGQYTLEVTSTKATKQPSEAATATFTITEPVPGSVRNAKCEAGNSRTQKTISWDAPTGTTMADEYDIRTTGVTRLTRSGVTDTSLTLEFGTGKTTVHITAVANSVSGGGVKLYSDEVSVECTVEPAPCGIPKNVTVEASAANKLNWTAKWESPEEDEPTPTGYEWTLEGPVERSGRTGALVRTVQLNSLTASDDTYTFSVRMTSASCKSDYVPVEFSVSLDPINPPTGLTSMQDEDATPPRDVTISWTAPTTGLTPSGYKVRLSGTKTVAAMDISGTRHIFSQLAIGSYTAYVRSVRGDREGTEEAQVTFDVETPPVKPPGEPQGLSHSLSADGTGVTYTWSAPAEDGGAPITGYEWSQSGGPDAMGTADSGATTVQQSGLKVGKTYTFSVAATNSAGTGPAATITFTAEKQKQRPNPVENLMTELDIVQSGLVGETPVGASVNVDVSWQAPSEGDPPDHYTLTLDGSRETRTDNTSFRYTNIGTGEKTVCVIAHNDVGASDPRCDTFDAVNCYPPNTVSNLTASRGEATIGGANIIASWNAPESDDTHDAATKYSVDINVPGTPTGGFSKRM